MRTTPKIRLKPSPEELKTIDIITIDFIVAIMTKDITAMEKLLHEEYKYVENFNKWATLKWFKEQFEKEIPEELINMEIKEHVCIGCQCGNRSLMFHHGYFPVTEDFGNPPKTLTLSFENGKLNDISICYSYLSAEKVKERSELN